jgi:hypothetical protein
MIRTRNVWYLPRGAGYTFHDLPQMSQPMTQEDKRLTPFSPNGRSNEEWEVGTMRRSAGWTCVLGLVLGLLGACATSRSGKTTARSATPADVQREIASWSKPGRGFLTMADHYCYADPLDPARFGNTFLLGHGQQVVSISLYALSNGGKYRGDQFMVTDLSSGKLESFDPAVRISGQPSLQRFHVSVSPSEGDSSITVEYMTGSRATLSLSQLTRWRLQNIKHDITLGRTTYKVAYQGFDMATMFFSGTAAAALLDPDSKREAMAPTYVVPEMQKQADGSWTKIPIKPIGDSGYVLDANMKVQLAK